MNVETVNDMVAQSLGNQQFLNELAGKKPNVFMRMYNWIKNVLFDGQNTGKTFNERRTDNKYLQELKNKFEIAYNTAYKNSERIQYALKGKDERGYPIYESDLIQEITNKEKIKNLQQQMKLLKEKPLFFNVNGQKIKAYFDDYGVQKTTYGTRNGEKAETKKGFSAKESLATDLYTIVNNSKFVGETDEISNISNTPSKNKAHKDVTKWYTFENKINYNGEIYTVLTTVRKKADGNYGYSIKFYENKKNNSVQAYSLKNFRDNTHSSYIDSIPSSDSTVNNQYMQNNEKNSQGLENSSSFSLQERIKQLENKLSQTDEKITLTNLNGEYVSQKSISKNGNVMTIKYTNDINEAVTGKKTIKKVLEKAKERNIELAENTIDKKIKLSEFERQNIENEIDALKQGYNSYYEYRKIQEDKNIKKTKSDVEEIINSKSYLLSKNENII